MAIEIQHVDSIHAIPSADWDVLAGPNILLTHAFLSAFERSKSVGAGTGWQPLPLVAFENGELVGAVPLYLKGHSYGEYVFDWSWADAYERAGMSYYPKLLAAIPFTPITGKRLLAKSPAVEQALNDALVQLMHQQHFSSTHVLFPNDQDAELFRRAGWLERHGVQFRWENLGFKQFEDFLQQLTHDKRKKIHQERKKVANADVTCQQLLGGQATQEDWDFFYRCYENTYREHHSTPYLTRAFFTEMAQQLPNNTLLVIAYQEGQRIASAFNVFDAQSLYGRYWGALAFVSGLHFEVCYYQAQQFCIERGIRYFEGGAQGEHKLARGFTPRPTTSFHQVIDANFEAAIRRFLAIESQGVANYHHELEERAPYKSD